MFFKKIAIAVMLGLSMGSAQAALLEFNGTYASDDDLDVYRFNILDSVGEVRIWSDTLTDGLDSQLTLFRLEESTGRYFWKSGFNTGFEIFNGNETRDENNLNQDGINEFGVALKNGYIRNDPDAVGLSDAGNVFSTTNPNGNNQLTAGSYLLVHTGFWDLSLAEFESRDGYFDEGFFDAWSEFGFEVPESRWSTFPFRTSDAPHAYKIFIEGNVAPVPVPGAIWLFGSAIAGLAVAGRGKKTTMAA